ncbi:MAG: hypothetical protein GY906_37600 [bacterium]|nr:hypothetical protein [bacterium]
MGDYDFKADTVNNRLYMKLSGFFRDSDSAPVFDAFIEAVDQLKPGFDVINDIRGFIPASPAAADTIKRAGKVITERKVGRTVRVTGKFITGLLQFKRQLFGVTDVEIVNSIEEAEELLDRDR